MGEHEQCGADEKNPAASRQPEWRLRRQQEILAAAFEEFAAKGYAEARLEDVAQRAGIAKGTIYLYFNSKALLFGAVLRELIHHVFEELESFVRTFPGSAEELIGDVVSRLYTEVVNNSKARSMLRLLIAESHKFPTLSEAYFREVVVPGMAAMRALIERGLASGEFRETKTAAFPQVLIGPAVVAVVWTLVLGDRQPLDLDAYMHAHLDLLLHGLQKPTLHTSQRLEGAVGIGEKQ